MIISFGVAGVWFVLFLVSFLRDQRLLRNGVYLVLTLLFAGLGVTPLLITSGGQGPDEGVPESHAMADYLIDHALLPVI